MRWAREDEALADELRAALAKQAATKRPPSP